MKAIRYFLQNKLTIIMAIGIILFIIIVIQIINAIIKNSNNNKVENNYSLNLSSAESRQLESAIGVSDNKTTETKKQYKNNISTFLDYCNNRNVEASYNMLTDDCKNLVFNNDINKFKTNYIDTKFNNKKSYTIQNWVGSIFKVSLKEDALSTGNSSNVENQEYISIENSKLNIANYLGYEEINKEQKNDSIKITVLKRYIFTEYETYDVKIENNCGESILLDDLSNTKTMYLTDNNKVKYYSAHNNLNKVLLTINNGEIKVLNIRFINPFISTRTINNIVFSNIKKLNSDKAMEILITL